MGRKSDGTQRNVSATQLLNLKPEASNFLGKHYNGSGFTDEDSSWNCNCDECESFMRGANSMTPKPSIPPANLRATYCASTYSKDSDEASDNSCAIHGNQNRRRRKPRSTTVSSFTDDDESEDKCPVHKGRTSAAHESTQSKASESEYEQIVEFSELIPAPDICCEHNDRKKPELIALASLEPVNDASMVFLQSGRNKRDDDTVTIYENAKPVKKEKPKKPKASRRSKKSKAGKTRPLNEDYENITEFPGTTNAPSNKNLTGQKNLPTVGSSMAMSGYDNIILAENGNFPGTEFPPTRANSLRVRHMNSSMEGKEKIDPIWDKLRKAFDDTTTARPSSKENVNGKPAFARTELVEKLSDPKFDHLRKLGTVESVVIGQLVIAAIFLVTSVALLVTGASLSAALFFAGLLIVVQLSPTILLWLIGSTHTRFVFQVSSQICAFFNGLLTIASWMLETEKSTRVFFLLIIATLQYGSLCLLKFYDYAEKYQRCQSKEAKADMGKLQALEHLAKGKKSPPPSPPPMFV